MKRVLVALGASAAVAFALASGKKSSSGASIAPLVYEVHAAGPHGPVWRTRPHALPLTARPCSAEGAAAPAIRAAAGREQLGASFEAFVLQLAAGESGQMFGRPANTFDARLMAGFSRTEARDRRLVPDVATRRPVGKPLITAWGAFQFNRDAWRDTLRALGETSNQALPFPWECTPEQEVSVPVRWYGRLWRQLRALGLSPARCGALCRVWHWSPVAYADAVRAVSRRGFATAWAAIPADRRATITDHIDDARIGGIA